METMTLNEMQDYIRQLENEKQTLSSLVVSLSLKINGSATGSNRGIKYKDEILFCDYMESWLETRASKIAPNTYQEYCKVLRKHIYPYFKKKGILIDDLTSADIEAYYAFKLQSGLSSNSVLKHHANIYSALKQATLDEIILVNPMLRVEKPKKIIYTANFYSPKQILDLFLIAKTSIIYVPIVLASLLGLRRSEIVGLKWDSINFSRGTIAIKRKSINIKGEKEDRTLTKLKSASSHRILALPEILQLFLKKLKQEQDCNRKNNPLYSSKCKDYVCLDAKGERIRLQYITEAFSRIIEENGLDKIRFHDLRHPYVKPTTKIKMIRKSSNYYIQQLEL